MNESARVGVPMGVCVCVCVWGGGSLGVCVASFDYLIFKTIGNLKFGIVTRWMGGTRWP